MVILRPMELTINIIHRKKELTREKWMLYFVPTTQKRTNRN